MEANMATVVGDPEDKAGFDLVAFLAIVVTIAFWASSFVVIRVCLGR
jgi:hypothetical protein